MLKNLIPEIPRSIFSNHQKEYYQCDAIAIDYAIIEKLKEILVIPASVGWTDIGSWKTVREINISSDKENYFFGNVDSENSKRSLIYSTNPNKKIAVIGLDKVIVVDTDDAILITNIENCEKVKKIVENLPPELQ